jgi:hypothetical protein
MAMARLSLKVRKPVQNHQPADGNATRQGRKASSAILGRPLGSRVSHLVVSLVLAVTLNATFGIHKVSLCEKDDSENAFGNNWLGIRERRKRNVFVDKKITTLRLLGPFPAEQLEGTLLQPRVVWPFTIRLLNDGLTRKGTVICRLA